MNIQEALARCIEAAHTERSVRTAKTYKSALTAFQKFLLEEHVHPTNPVADVKMNHFIRFPGWMLSAGFSKKTTTVYISGAKFFMDWLVIEGLLEPSYQEQLRYGKAVATIYRRPSQHLPRVPEEGATERVLAAARLVDWPSPIRERNIALLELLASSGLRNEESTKLLVKSIDLENRSGIVIGKGDKEAKFYFSTAAKEAIEAYKAARKKWEANQPLFLRHDRAVGKKLKKLSTVTVLKIVWEVMKMAGIAKGAYSPHRFRHFFILKVLTDTDNLAKAQDLARHASANTTRRYTALTDKKLEETHRETFQ